MFSKLQRWLEEVAKKSKDAIGPSNSNTCMNRDGCCPFSKYPTSALQPEQNQQESTFSNKWNNEIGKNLVSLAQSTLTERQKILLVSASQELQWESMTLTRLCSILSRESKMSYSTVKWNIRRLREINLLCGGTLNSKGTHAGLTSLGRLMALVHSQDQNRCNPKSNTREEATSTQ